MARVNENLGCDVIPTWHGTDRSNLESIYYHGLCIGGQEVGRKHGAAHGIGVYASNLNAPSLSMRFASHCEMLVCIVLNTSGVAPHGDAQLVSNRKDVVPVML